MKKHATPEGATCKADNLHGNTFAQQRQRLLAALKAAGGAGITTIQARERLDVMAPAPRIFELRHRFGQNIQTVWTTEINAQGNRHRCGRYVWMPSESEVSL